MTSQQSLNLEALKLIKELSIWMVAVQTSALVASWIGSAEKLLSFRFLSFPVFFFTSVCFAVSILTAAWVLSGIPYIVIRLDRGFQRDLRHEPHECSRVEKDS